VADFDVVVCGLGAMGSAALCALAARGKRVLGLERHKPGNDRGSSHGATRIIRLGYFEHPSYVPLLRRAYALWRDLERASGLSLVHRTGILEIGSPESDLVRGTLASSSTHGLAHEVLSASQLMRRYSAFALPADYVGVLQPDGGWLAVEAAFAAWTSLAARAGAEMRSGDIVHQFEESSGGVRVHTSVGAVEAGAAIVAAGAWTQSLMPSFALPLRVTREVMGWFAPCNPALCTSDRLPVFLLESRHGMHYGIPPEAANIAAGIKVAKHHHRGETVDPDAHDRNISPEDEALIRGALADHVPAANGPLLAARTCLYTVTPDHHFIIDRVPGSSRIVLVSACSGHGFKFAPVIGEIVADLATLGHTSHDITRFRLDRFD
jgi:sarcosine oxidase